MPPRQRFEVLRRLGGGGMGDVFLVRDSGLPGTPLAALKRLRAEWALQPEALAQFDREARIGELLRHPNIAPVLAHGHDAQGPFLVMEYVDGCSADRVLEAAVEAGESLSAGALAQLGADVARALAAGHSLVTGDRRIRGVVHRDVSPENVLVSRAGEVKLADFGVAQLVGATVLTQTGSLKGKLGYMAPEVFEGAEQSAASDVWALAVSLYRLATGVDAFPGANPAQLVQAVLTARPAPLTVLRPELPAALVEAVEAGMARDPGGRPDAAGMARRLEPLCSEIARQELASRVEHTVARLTAPAEALRPVTQLATRRRTSRAPWLIAGVGLAAAGVVGVGVWRRAPEGKLPALATTAGDPGASAAAARASVASPAPGPIVSAGSGQGLPGTPTVSSSEGVQPAPPSPTGGQISPAAPRADPESVASLSGPGATAHQPSSKPRPPRHRSPSVEAPRPPSGSGDEAQPAAGTLAIKVRPWGRVFVDGAMVGTTPLAPLALAAGDHSVMIVNEELDVRRQQTVRVRAGTAEELRVVLDSAAP